MSFWCPNAQSTKFRALISEFLTKTHRDHKLQRNLISLCELSIQQTILPLELSFTSVQTTTHGNVSRFNSTPYSIQVWIRSLSLLQSLLIFINYLIRNLKFPTNIFALLSLRSSNCRCRKNETYQEVLIHQYFQSQDHTVHLPCTKPQLFQWKTDSQHQ